ncbi:MULTISPECIES: hypothetical protein [Ralstonia solanacearum species complex]|uniref:Uncharacterized protein n=1 Tax=Ralstonia solanacearum IPO1609 TaxID=564066 RepID=A0ABF7RFF6_RALSL|nr:hypothetical protein [Ralstonia solanacearum]MDC6252882.1 hypothetical protein [Ralstonia solanacearum]MDC6257464.1 hypothetical protein [Ralstonia solanacearum]MDC6301880.1 hypothetical protein [Ralstonia solanacearum]MDN4064317.1 hypothetical protein [Ralstonia solanacearum]CEJ20253.1 hypothetical protein RSIPO_02424 [Ralstonia solanacearum IPO1609]
MRNWLASGQTVRPLDIASASPHAYCIVRREQAQHFADGLLGLDG